VCNGHAAPLRYFFGYPYLCILLGFKVAEGSLYVLLMFYFFIFLVISVRNIYQTEICMIGRTLAVDERSKVIFFDPSRDVAVVTNFVGKIDLQYTPCSSHDIR